MFASPDHPVSSDKRQGARTHEEDGLPSGSIVPADLIPYLEVANEPDTELAASESSTGKATAHNDSQKNDNRTAALHSLIENSLLAGPLPTIIDEHIDGDDEQTEEWDIWDDDRARTGALETTYAIENEGKIDEEFDRIYQEIISRRPEHDVQPSLDRVNEVLDILGSPQTSYPAIHLTGTNGKTSTSRMIDRILIGFGVKTGRFTSPHLIDMAERISFSGEPISHHDFISIWNEVSPYINYVDDKNASIGQPKLSFFEMLTVAAYAAFADRPIDAAVVEVGMGGRWDATNVIDAGVSVFTPIDTDHRQWLGNTPEKIAHEKVGIIKPQQIVVTSEQNPEVLKIIKDRAFSLDALLRVEGEDFTVLDRKMGIGGQLITVRTPAAVYEDLFLPLHGEHQAHNAALALVAAESFMGGKPLEGTILEEAFTDVTSPGRVQVLRSSPTILVDAAHNPSGVRSLKRSLDDAFDFARINGIFSSMSDKDIEEMLGEMEPVLDTIAVVEMPGERAASLEELTEIANDVFGPDRVISARTLGEAVEISATNVGSSLNAGEIGATVVFGSIQLIGETMKLVGSEASAR